MKKDIRNEEELEVTLVDVESADIEALKSMLRQKESEAERLNRLLENAEGKISANNDNLITLQNSFNKYAENAKIAVSAVLSEKEATINAINMVLTGVMQLAGSKDYFQEELNKQEEK